tara:strand:- start:351 stop:581 length:231 start_codon:yes stop_codon:yes gene_type:complete
MKNLLFKEMDLITSHRDLMNVVENNGYEYGLHHLNIYEEDFKDSNTWKEVLQCLGTDDCYGVTLAIVGIKKELEED